MYAAIPSGDVTPGTTSNGMPASASASASSPPRPKMNGSPPFSRTTLEPAPRALDHHFADFFLRASVLGFLLADVNQFGVRGREAQQRFIGQMIVQHDIGVLENARGLCR